MRIDLQAYREIFVGEPESKGASTLPDGINWEACFWGEAAVVKYDHLRGYFYIAAATFCWGVAASLGRAAFTGQLLPDGDAVPPIDALVISQTRTTFSFLILLPILLIRWGPRALRFASSEPRSLRVSWRQFGNLALYGMIGQAAANFFYYTAIERTNVATAIIIQYTAPVWVLLYLAAVGRQKVTGRKGLAVVLAIFGSALVINIVEGGLAIDHLGLIAAFLSAITFAFSNLWGHYLLQSHDRWTTLLYCTFTAGILWSIINPPWKLLALNLTATHWLFLMGFAVISVLLPLALYYAGLQVLEPVNAIVASCLEPVFAIVIAAVALGETMQAMQVAGMILVLSAIVLVQMPSRRQDPIIVAEPVD